jgi:hypothetical protein
MIVVALVALLMGGGVRLNLRREHFTHRALHHAMFAQESRRIKQHAERNLRSDPFLDEQLMPGRSTGLWLEGLTRMDQWIVYHATLQRKYEEAARRPWLPVEPDPPAEP